MRAAAVEACEARVGGMEVGSVVATCGEAGWAMWMVAGEAAMAAGAIAAAAMAVVAMVRAAAARAVAAEMVAAAQTVAPVTAVAMVQEEMATVVEVEADMARVGGMEVGSVMAKHVKAG